MAVTRPGIVVAGHGAAGLCAALAALEAARERGVQARVTVLERTPEADCGGFQGNGAMLREHFGPGGESLRPISPGTSFDDGSGIRAALQAGARWYSAASRADAPSFRPEPRAARQAPQLPF